MIEAPAASRPLDAPRIPRWRPAWKWAGWVACCLLIALLPFVTSPGNIIADSKLDLPVNPVSFLVRALSLWDQQEFGQLQNQANGYLFPQGPFFALGKLSAVPPWITQRLWISAVLIAAFTGTVVLARRLGIGTPWSRAVGGFAFALSPMALTLLGEYSGEYLPQAIAPWIIIPLIGVGARATAARPAHPARAAAQSAFAVALCSGVNAACALAAMIPAFIYILTRHPGLRRRLLAWWVPAVVLATLWWTVPLALLAKYGVSFLPYTESAAATTGVTGLDSALRGTENWIGYLVIDGQPWWRVGYRLATAALPTLLSGLIVALGLAGLARRRVPERRFLLWTLLAGLVIISSGHPSLGNPLAGPIATIINGPGAAFRNFWKFDPLIRIPMALGLAYLLPAVHARRRQVTAIALAAVSIGGVALPVYFTGLANAGSFSQIPSYWTATADWLNTHAGHQGVLLLPSATFGQYTWGSPLDEVIQPLTTVDWDERNLSMVSSDGTERLLDAIEQQLGAGTGSAGLTQVIAQMGVKYVVIRNDLDPAVLQGALPSSVHQALAESPGLTEVASFGPLIGATGSDTATNLSPPYPAVQVYQVGGAQPAALVQPTAGTLRVYGAPEAMLTMANEGLLGDRPVLLDNDGAGLPVAGTVDTDALRRRVRDFGEIWTSYSPTLTATQPATTFEAATDYLQPDWSQYLSVAQYSGIKDVTASSSASDIQVPPSLWASGLQPYAAVDGDLRTKWESGSWTGPLGQWLQVDFDNAIPFGSAADPSISVGFVENSAIGPPVSQVVVQTAAGQVTDNVQDVEALQSLRVPRGASTWLRITIKSMAWAAANPLGTEAAISELQVPGVTASRTIVAPPVPGGDPTEVVLAKAQPQPSGCALGSRGWACSPTLAVPTEEQYGFSHAFYEGSAKRAVLSGSAVLADPSLADLYAQLGGNGTTVTGSSTYTDDVEDQARSAFDGNPATSWIASTSDAHPTLTIHWKTPRVVRQVTIKRPPGAAGLLPVLVAGSGGQAAGAMLSGASDTIKFKPMRTTSLTLAFTPDTAPLQVTDVSIPGVPFLTTPSVPFRLACGLGPQITLNGKAVPTRVTGTFAELLSGQPMQFTACSPVTLAAGLNQVTEPTGDAFSVQDAVLGGPAAPAAAQPAVAAGIQSWSSSKRVLTVDAKSSSYLEVNENFNKGWHAVIDGRQLQAVQLNGWKQAWLLPAGTHGVVTLTYTPDRIYLVAVVGGLGLLLLILLAAFWPARWLPARLRDASRWPGPRRLGRLAARLARPGRLAARWNGSRPRRVRLPAPAVTLLALALTGLWLGGYAGLVIVPVATLAALALARRDRPVAIRRVPWLLGGLAIAATVIDAIGQHMLSEGSSGSIASALYRDVPQLVCLLLVAGLIAVLLERGGGPAAPAGGLPADGHGWGTLSEDDPLWTIRVSPGAGQAGADVTRPDLTSLSAAAAAEVEAALARARQLGLSGSGARALDFGCGAGALTQPLAAHYRLVTGMDTSPRALAVARRDNPLPGRLEFLLSDGPDLAPLPDGEFDLVYSGVVPRHLPRAAIEAYLAGFARVLRPGGTLIVALPTGPRALAYRWLPAAAVDAVARWLPGYRADGITERQVYRLLAAHGVAVLAADTVAGHPEWRERRYFGRRVGPPAG